jgi:hypothetical protein
MFLMCQINYSVFAKNAKTSTVNNSGLFINGIWKIVSTENGINKTGFAYISKDSKGKIRGFAELQSLPGMSRIYGKTRDLSFHLWAKSENQRLQVKGMISPDGKKLSGFFNFSPHSKPKKFAGTKLNVNIKVGEHSYNSKNKVLSVKMRDGTSQEYLVTEITATMMKLNTGQIWTRAKAKANSIYGIWKTEIESTQYQMVLFEDNTVHFIIRDEKKDLPGIDMSGVWFVTSVLNGEKRTGRAFIDMAPSGRITGFGELTSLSGLSTIIGKLSDDHFSLTLKSPNGQMIVEGKTNDHQSVDGIFYISGIDKRVPWTGKLVNGSVKNGKYTYNAASNILTFFQKNKAPVTYHVKKITEHQITFQKEKSWNRTSGAKKNITGVWKRSGIKQNKFIILLGNNKMMTFSM